MKVLKQAELRLWVYGGDILNHPDDPNYLLTKVVPSTEVANRLANPDLPKSVIVFEISELIKDYVTIEFDGNYNTLVQTKWVRTGVRRTYVEADGTETSDTTVKYGIAFRGYGNISEGINPELSKTILISNTVINNKCGSFITAPFYSLSVDPNGDTTAKVIYNQDQTELDSNPIAGSISEFTIAQEVKIDSAVDDVITIDKTFSVTASPDNSVNTEEIPIDANRITYTDSSGVSRSIDIKCIDDCKYDAQKVSFINKFGVMQDMWFFAKRTDSMSSQRESYRSTKLDISSIASYKVSDHENSYLENQGKERFTMNTGFIHESYGEVVKELLVSEYVYMYDINRFSPSGGYSNLAVPVSIASSNVDIKTRLNDKLIEYTLEFEADSDFIQSVR